MRCTTVDPRRARSDDLLNSVVRLGTEAGWQCLGNLLLEDNLFNGQLLGQR